MTDNVETIAYVGQTPWHGLGVRVQESISTDQMLIEAGIDWTVERYPAYANINGQQIKSKHELLVRSTDFKVLDEVTADWNPVQNATAMEMFRKFVEAGKMSMHTAGSLDGGRVVWALAKLNDTFEVVHDDSVESYMLFFNPHKYASSCEVRFTPIRVVCQNTLTLALRKGDEIFRKSHRSIINVEEVQDVIEQSHQKMLRYKEQTQFLSTRRYTEDDKVAYIAEVFPIITRVDSSNLSKSAKRVLPLIEQQPGHQYAEGTYWSLFNAATYFIDHQAGSSTDKRLTSAWLGRGKRMKDHALNTALRYANAA